MANDSANFMVALIDKVTGPARKMQGALGRLQKSIKNVMKGAQGRDEMGRFTTRAGGMMKSLQGSFKGAGKRLGEAVETGVGKLKDGLMIAGAVLGGVAAGIGALTIKMADFAQVSMLGFQSVAKHGASAEKLFAHARTLAEDLGLDVLETSKTFNKFLALQFDPKMATDLIKMGSDLRAFGATGEEVQRIFAQLGQVQAKGKLQGEELIVLAENGISTQLVYEQLAKTLGKTKDEVMAMQQAGKLTSDMAFPAIMAAVMKKTGTKEVGEVGKKIADSTLGGMAGQLKARAQNMFIDIGRASTPALMEAFAGLKKELDAVLKDESFKGGIVDAVTAVANAVQFAIPYVKGFVSAFSEGFGEAWPAMKETIGIMTAGFGTNASWMDRVKAFAKTMGELTAFTVAFGAAVIGAIAGTFELAAAIVRVVQAVWGGLVSGIGAAIFAVGDFFANLSARFEAFDLGASAKAMLEGLVNGLKAGAQWVVDTVKGLGTAIVDGFRSVLKIQSPSKVFAHMGEMSGVGFNLGLANALAANDNGPKLSSFTGELEQGPVMSSFRAGDIAYAGGGAGNSGGAPRINVTIHVHQQPGESGTELAENIRGTIRQEVSGILEEWLLETG